MRARLALAHSPRGRVQAVIDTNLAPEEFDKRSGTAWLAFWGQVLHVEGLKRVQTAYQKRMLSNLRSDLRQMIPGDEARTLAAMIAAMIDGVWLRAALSEWQEADSESARALLTAFVDGRLKELTVAAPGARSRRARTAAAAASASSTRPPARTLAQMRSTGRRRSRQPWRAPRPRSSKWSALTGAERGRILQQGRAAAARAQ